MSLWESLQGKKAHMPHFLTEVSVRGLRGMGLRIRFDYPVSVIAGGNTSGKTTVLFAAACAYKAVGGNGRPFTPSALFPDYRPQHGQHRDEKGRVTIDFDYATPEGQRAMRWRRSKSWSRSFFGRRGATQPERQVYLRTLSNLRSPSEVRGVLSLSRLDAVPREQPLSAQQIHFAQQLLPFTYSEVVDLSSGRRNLLFASQEGGAAYSELHMAAGERAILRLSQEIAQLKGALILIDEVEAGLHPWVQQLLMLHLQQLALLNDLQVIVTTHSPVVLDSVPTYGRIFLDRRDSGRVEVLPSYRDFVQNALYGRSNDALNLLCEDAMAEAVLCGVLDVLLPGERMNWEAVRIGRDTGADEFPAHATAFRKFGQTDNVVFVLDGDMRGSGIDRRIRSNAAADVPVFFLPGRHPPEVWTWRTLEADPTEASRELRIDADELRERMGKLDAVYDSASDTPAAIAKAKLRSLAEPHGHDAETISRVVAQIETTRSRADTVPLAENLRNVLTQWRFGKPLRAVPETSNDPRTTTTG